MYIAPSQCSLPHPHLECMRVSLEKRLLGKVEMLVHHQVLLKYFVYVLTRVGEAPTRCLSVLEK